MGKRKEEKTGEPSGLTKTDTTSTRPSQVLNSTATPDTRSMGGTSKPDPKWSSGSWRGKATAVAEIARENIAVVANAASDRVSVKSIKPKEDPQTTQRPARKFSTPTKSLPSAASMTKLNVTSGVQDEPNDVEHEDKANESKSQIATTANLNEMANDAIKGEEIEGKHRPIPASGWRGWWTTSATSEKGPNNEAVDAQTPSEQLSTDIKDVKNSGNPTIRAKGRANSTIKPSNSTDSNIESTKDNIPIAAPPDSSNINTTDYPPRSWFGLWSPGQPANSDANTASTPQKSRPSVPSVVADEATGKSVPKQSSGCSADVEAKKSIQNDSPKALSLPSNARPTSGSWAFWSREKAESDAISDGQTAAGEFAVADTASQSNSIAADAIDVEVKRGSKSKNSKKRNRPQSLEVPAIADVKKLQVEASPKLSPQQSPVLKTKEKTPSSIKSFQPNLLLPAFGDTFQAAEAPSYFQQVLRLLGRSTPAPQSHVYLSSAPPKIQKAIAIGVHGYFPTPLIQRVIGQPTGTSIRFANEAAASIQRWATCHNLSCDVEKIALEGEGMISDRVEILWKLMLNWIDQIRKADFILVACHSQGVPVAIMLLARLIDFGCVSSSARVGMCAMAGVNLGPFVDYKSRFFGGSASELFDFSRPDSAVTQKYAAALSRALTYGVRIVYIGSIDDQLVSLESSTFSNVSHPYIYRAVFVDGRIHAPDFITHLVGFALKLRNLGISDHGLIRELSSPLAGSLYTGEGHSRIYEEQAVYNLAVEHALQTTSVGDVPVSVRRYEIPAATTSNPYFLPWAMRGVLEEDFVRTELEGETGELLKEFDAWKPSSKVLKDVKFRLEAVKSKL